MQIDRLNHLLFPPDSKLPAGKDASDPAATPAVARAARPHAGLVQSEPQSPPVLNSVVLSIQSQAGAPTDAKAPVYTSKPKLKPEAVSEDGDAGRRAEQHKQAVDRQAGVQTRIAVDKDGVLVAKSAAASASARPAGNDFVSHAVSAMRDYADEMERLKSARSASEGASTAAVRALQQITNKLKAFAHV
jgi:hypothetical protein